MSLPPVSKGGALASRPTCTYGITMTVSRDSHMRHMHYFWQFVSTLGNGLPLFTELPRRGLLGNPHPTTYVKPLRPGPDSPVQRFVAIMTFCGPCARSPCLVIASGQASPPLPPVSHGSGVLCCGKGFRTMNTVYATIYIVAAAVVITVAFLVVTALTP